MPDIGDEQPETTITKGQLEAIEEAMRIIVEEDRQRGVDPLSQFRCTRCKRSRQVLGSVEYDGIRLCNECATRFEVARISGQVRTSAQYVGETAGAH